MDKRLLTLTVAAFFAITAIGCGSSNNQSTNSVDPNATETSPPGDIPDDQVFVRYRPKGAPFSVEVPEGWSRTSAGGATTFTDKLNSVTMQTTEANGPLTQGEAKTTTIPDLTKTTKDFADAQVTTVSRSAGPATLITYTAASPPDPVTGKTRTDAVEQYTFYENGHRVVLTLSGPDGADNVDPWKIVSDSLRFTG